MENIEILKQFFGWCTVLNISILILASIGLVIFKGPVARIHGAMMGIDEKALNKAYFNYLANYKIAIFIFCLAPYLTLKVMI